MASDKAKKALSKASDPRLSPDAIAASLIAARADLRDATLAATEMQFDLAEVDDQDERRTGIVEMEQKVGGFLREAGKLREQLSKVLKIAHEIDESAPMIAERLGLE